MSTSSQTWWADVWMGLTCDHLYEFCPNRMRAEKTLRLYGWWQKCAGHGLDPLGTDVCGFCVARYKRQERTR